MRIAFAAIEITWSSLGTALGLIGLICVFIGYAISQYRKGSDEATGRALNNWKDLAGSETARRMALEGEKLSWIEREKHLTMDLEECAEFRDQFAQHLVRSAAREGKYQECINNLERAANVPITRFDDPREVIKAIHGEKSTRS
jgi:hypothetical protein